MITFVTDDFTGANGSAPNATYWATGGGDTAGASETIQGNRLRVNTGTLTGYAGQAAAKFIGSRPGNTVDLTVTFNTSSTTDSNCEIWVNSTDSPFSSNNGYFLPVGPPASGAVQMLKAVGASYSSIGATKTFTINSDTDYTARIFVGGVGPVTIRWKLWLASTPEPVAWDAQFTDTANFNTGAFFLHPVGGSAAGGYTDFDNVIFTDGGDPYGGLYTIRPPSIVVPQRANLWTPSAPALPVLVMPPLVLGAEELRIQVAIDPGEADLGLSATATAAKVVTASAVASIGASATASATTVRTRTGTAAVGLAGLGTGRKVMARTGTAAVGLATVTTARKVTIGSGIAPVGPAGIDTARKVTIGSGIALAGLAGLGTGRKVMAKTGVSAVGLTGGTTARKVSTPTGPGALGLTGITVARKVSTPTGPGAIGLTGITTASKITIGTGAGFLGLTARGGLGRAATATGALGLTAWATASRTALPTASAALGLAARAGAARVAEGTARAVVGLAGSGGTVHRATVTGRSLLGLSGAGGARHVASATGRAAGGLAASGAARKVVGLAGISSLGLAGVQAISTRFAQAIASLGLTGRGGARRVAQPIGSGALGLAAQGRYLILRAATARAFLGLTTNQGEPVFVTERRPQGQTGGWVTLRTILDEVRIYADPGPSIACPVCGEPLIGDWCPFGVTHIPSERPPTLVEDLLSDPGPWESLLGILRDAGSNAVEESRTPELACPACGEPLVAGHCPFDGYQSEHAQE